MHSCPICDAACYCGGDIDDSDVGDVDAQDDCTHCDDEEDWHRMDEADDD